MPAPRTVDHTARRHEGPARGVVVGLVISLPFWVLVLVAARLF